MIGLFNKILAEGHKAQPLCASLFARTDMGIEGIDFDLFIDESHGLDFKISEHPLQDGCVITDHVTQQLRTCKINAMFTNHSVRGRSGNEKEISIEGYEEAEPIENVARQKFEALEELAKRREPVRLVTSLVVYPKMMIKNVNVQRGPSDGESVKFSMTLTEIKTVKLFSVTTDFIYQEGSVKDSISKLTSTVNKQGLTSGDVKAVNDILKTVGFSR